MVSIAVPLFTASINAAVSDNSTVRHNNHVGFFIRSSVVLNNGGTTHRILSSMSNLRRRSCVRDTNSSKMHCSLLEVEENERDDEACELVSGSELSLGDGQIRAYLFKAVKNNNGTGILLLSDIFGFEDSFTRDFAYRVACNGYNVLVPDLFRGDPWTSNKPKSTFEQWLSTHHPEKTLTDITTSQKWMVEEFIAAGISNKLGIIGFCYGGGRLIDVLARDTGDHFGLGVSFYGTRIDQSIASNVKVPVLFISGDEDPLCPIDVVEKLRKGIGNGSMAVIFEGRGHGFAHRPQSQEEDGDADKAFLVMRDWLRDGLLSNCSK